MADIYITRGDARDLDILIQDPDGVSINIIDWKARFALCRNVFAEDPLIDWDSEDNDDAAHFNIGLSDPFHVIVSLTEEDTAALEPGWYSWDLRMIDLGSQPFTPISGYLRIGGTQLPGTPPASP